MNSHFLFTLLMLLAGAFSQTSVAATGGPDAFGHVFTESSEPGGPVYSFEDIPTTGAVSTVSSQDDGGELVSIGFSFDFYGAAHTRCGISSNGFLSLGAASGSLSAAASPNPGDPNNLIAGWWRDLNPAAGGNVYSQTLGTAPNRRFIVQFQSVQEFGTPANLNTFQFKLFEGSNRIEVHYQGVALTAGNNLAIGIENADGTDGLSYHFGTTLPAIGGGPFAVRYASPGFITVANTNNSGAGSLRQAITDAMTFESNHATQRGGAIFNEGGTLVINRSTFVGNTAPELGGAISNEGPLTATHSIFTGNQATGVGGSGLGGAIFNFNFPLTLTHCTLTGNKAVDFGGALRTQGGTVTLENTIVAGNAASISRDFANAGATFTALGRNLIGDNSSVTAQFPAGPLAGTISNPLDPKLSALGYYGGPTQSMHPLINSAAIDPAGGATASAHTTDQRGLPRVIDGGRTTGSAIADLGAVEAGPVLEVGTSNAGGAGSLQTHLNAVRNTPAVRGQHIVFDPAEFPATIVAGEVVIQDSTVFIDASDIGGTGVQISGGDANRVLRVDEGLPGAHASAMHSVTLRNGNGNAGAGVFLTEDLTLVRCTVSDNVATESGGGLFLATGSRLVLDHCTISGNEVTGGGGGGGGMFSFGTTRMMHCTVSGNESSSVIAGGRQLGGLLTLENSIVAGNLSNGTSSDLSDSGTVFTAGENLIGISVGHALTGPLVGVDAKLLPLGNYGGPTQTMPPRVGSPAINAATGLVVDVTDQRAAPRVIGTASDLGAAEALIESLSLAPGSGSAIPQPITWTGAAGATFEVFFGTATQGLVLRGNQVSPFTPSPPLDFDADYVLRIDTTLNGVVYTGETVNFSTRPMNPVVTTVDDENDGLDLGGISLREALAVVTDGETITFAPALTGGTITLGGSELTVDQDITIDASALNAGITISGGNASRVFNIAAGTIVTLDALTITDGVAASGHGGGILNNGILTLRNSTVSSNEVSTGGSGFGGGIATTAGGRLVTANCTVTGNTATNGGGIYTFSGGSGTSVLESTTITENTASNVGGGMRLISPVRFTNSIVSGNSASGSGPDALNSSPSATGVNLIGNLSGSGLTEEPTVIVGAPLLATLGYYGGPTQTMPPKPGSPAIDTGGATNLLTDQRGFPRVIGGTVDIGAVEAGSANFNPTGLTLTTQGPDTLTKLEISTDPNFLNTVGTLAGTGSTVFADGPHRHRHLQSSVRRRQG